ncbi:putative 3'-5' exonuclease [Sphingomonas paucimobilis]|nr:putative 3'-5' exonuclease [Sphingomonas paucimobilis]
MAAFTFFDTESAWDEDLHEAYRRIDPKVQPHHRLGSKRIFAAAALDLTLTDNGQISCDAVHSWTEHDHGDEEAVVSGLFDHLRARPDRVAVVYGSIAADVPLLLAAAMQHGIVLPSQFIERRSFSRAALHPHTDVGLVLKGGGKTWHHMAEVALRLGLPVDLLDTKARVDFPRTADQWQEVRAHVELDAALVGIVMLAWLKTQGQACLQPTTMMIAVLDWIRRNGHMTVSMADKIAASCSTLIGLVEESYLNAA